MFGLGVGELIVILVIVLIVFGVGKLPKFPELGSGLGEGIRNFKKAMQETKTIDVTPPPQQPTEKKE